MTALEIGIYEMLETIILLFQTFFAQTFFSKHTLRWSIILLQAISILNFTENQNSWFKKTHNLKKKLRGLNPTILTFLHRSLTTSNSLLASLFCASILSSNAKSWALFLYSFNPWKQYKNKSSYYIYFNQCVKDVNLTWSITFWLSLAYALCIQRIGQCLVTDLPYQFCNKRHHIWPFGVSENCIQLLWTWVFSTAILCTCCIGRFLYRDYFIHAVNGLVWHHLYRSDMWQLELKVTESQNLPTIKNYNVCYCNNPSTAVSNKIQAYYLLAHAQIVFDDVIIRIHIVTARRRSQK